MSRECYVCGKKPVTGNRVRKRGQKPYITGKSKRRWLPNLQRVKVKINGGNKRVRVCANCLRSGKVQKAI
ncbi:TPA: 50S ribosomal protein L28 [Candidatus Poribacteria bacterium]|nr:50S ribosomal protein L28 [Candidatus Poribacteria bacterium]